MRPKTITVSYDVVVIPHDGFFHCSKLCPYYKDDEGIGDFHKRGYCKMFNDILNSFASLKEPIIDGECQTMLRRMGVKKPGIKRRKWKKKPHATHRMSRYYLRKGFNEEKPAWCRECTACHGSQQEFKGGGIKHYSSGLDSPCDPIRDDDDIPDDY